MGERVRSKKFGTVWKVIEEREVWAESKADGSHARPIPAIYIRYWKEDTAKGPGTGKTMSFRYSVEDPNFEDHWEILYDW